MVRQIIEKVEPLRTKEEIKNMREALKQTNYAKRNLLLFNLGINTGLRISDILNIKVEDVRGKTSIYIREKKTNKKRQVYLDSMLVEITDYLAEIDPEDIYLFESRRKGRPISTVQAYRTLAGAGEACGYDYVGTHTLRKTFGFHYYKKTKDIATLMYMFNHDSQSVTKRYIGITDEEVKDSLKDFRL